MGVKFYIVLVLAFILTVRGRLAYKKKIIAGDRLGSLKALVAVLVGITVVFVCVIIQLVAVLGKEGTEIETFVNKHALVEYKVYQYLGNYLAENHAADKLVIFDYLPEDAESQGDMPLNIEDENERPEDNRMEGFKAGLAGRLKITKIIHPEMSESKAKAIGMPIRDLMRREGERPFDNMLAQCSKKHVIVSFVDLPDNFQRITMWRKRKGGRPKLILISARGMDVERLIRGGEITAVMYTDPKVGIDMTDPDLELVSFEEIFHRRHFIITAANIDQAIEKFPGIFKASQ